MDHKVIVYFHSIPIGEMFYHKGERWRKTEEEKAFSYSDNKEYVFEVHHGCVIDYDRADELELRQEDYIHC